MGNERLNGELITNYRKETKTPYGALAAKVGVGVSTLRLMEQGYIPREQRDAILASLARILGCDVGALVIQEREARTA